MRQVLIVENLKKTRRWLAEFVQAVFPDCEIHEAVSLRSGTALMLARDHGMALISLGRPDGSGLDVLRLMRQRNPETDVSQKR